MNPFRRITLLERQVLDLQDALSAQSTTITALSAQLADQGALIGLLTATDTMLERIAKATEYLQSVEHHRQQNAGQRHEF